MIRTILTLVLALPALPLLHAQEQVTEEVVNREKAFIEANREKLLGNYEEAIDILRDLHRQLPDEAAIAFELGRLYYASENATEAERYLKMARELDPTNDWYAKFLADVYQAAGRDAEGAEIYEQLVERHPDDLYLYFKWAFFLVRAQKVDEALKVYDNLERRIGINEEIARRKHTLYLGQGDTRRAKRELENLINAFPRVVAYRHLLAEFLDGQGEKAEAQRVYREILAIEPADARAQLALAGGSNLQRDEIRFLRELQPVFERADVEIDMKISQLYPFISKVSETGDREIADAALELTQTLERVHGSDPKSFAAAGDLLFYSGRKAEALQKYRATLELDESVFLVWAQALQSLYDLEDFAGLLELANEALDVFPNRSVLQYYYALGADGLGRYDDALDALSLAKMMAGRDPQLQAEALALTGQVYAHNGQMGAARDAFDEARELLAQAPEVAYRYSQFLLLQDQADAALEQAQAAYELDPLNPHYAHGLSRAQYAQGEYASAEQTLADALEQGAEAWPTALELRGDIRYRLNDVAGAVEWWRKAQQTGSDSEQLERKIAERKIVE